MVQFSSFLILCDTGLCKSICVYEWLLSRFDLHFTNSVSSTFTTFAMLHIFFFIPTHLCSQNRRKKKKRFCLHEFVKRNHISSRKMIQWNHIVFLSFLFPYMNGWNEKCTHWLDSFCILLITLHILLLKLHKKEVIGKDFWTIVQNMHKKWKK